MRLGVAAAEGVQQSGAGGSLDQPGAVASGSMTVDPGGMLRTEGEFFRTDYL